MSDIVASGYLNRHIIERIMSDRSRQFACRTHQNPIAYHDGSQLRPINIGHVADTVTDRGEGIYLRKSIVSVGLKKADDPYKFIGIRPDNDQGGSTQLEFSLGTIEVNGKAITTDLSQKAALTAVSHRVGPLVVQARRQGMRVMLPLTDADDGFKLPLILNLKGCRVTYRADLDEYWIYRDNGEFFTRLRKPVLIDPVTGGPLVYESDPGRYEGLVRHSLTEIGQGQYAYVKEPTEAFGKVRLPATFLVDADTVYSSTADSFVYKLGAAGASWSSVRDGTTGSGTGIGDASATDAMGVSYSSGTTRYQVKRSLFVYPLNDLAGTVESSGESLRGYTLAHTSCTVQQGTFGSPITTGDYDSFSGSAWGTSGAWDASGYNTVTYNSTGVSAVQSALGDTHKSCWREATKDYANVAPTSQKYNGCYYADDVTYDPTLTINITPFAWKIKVGGWKTVTAAQILVGGAWKPISKEMLKVGAWKNC